MEGKCDNIEGDSNREHPFPRVSKHKRRRLILQSLECIMNNSDGMSIIAVRLFSLDPSEMYCL